LSGAVAQTWIELDGTVYGAKPDEQGPIGGGKGYKNQVTHGDYTVQTLDSLLAALAVAKRGETIFIPGETLIDLTARIYIERLVLELPSGVTLAGNRGDGGSRGAILTSDTLNTRPMLKAMGSNVRVTGLRLRGPNTKRYLEHHERSLGKGGLGHDYYYKLPTSRGIITEHPELEVDNCEISGFSHAGILLLDAEGHRIHHNYIHHCQYQGLGYGVCQNTSSSVIEFNLFNWNRHSIAGTGRPGSSYLARHNVELGVSLSHCFDMHGGRDRKDGTDTAGTSIEIHNNTFRAPQTPVVIRGVPEEECLVHQNWFPVHSDINEVVRAGERTRVVNNAFETGPVLVK
jgi:hypothetical protein